MLGLRRTLRNDTVFFYTSFVLFFAALFCLRLFVVDYDAYRRATRDQVVEFLNATNFPRREETHQAILAAVLSLREPEGAELSEGRVGANPAFTLQDELHEAVSEIWRQAIAGTTSADVRKGLYGVYDCLSRDVSMPAEMWVAQVTDRIRKFESDTMNVPIIPCPDEEANYLRTLYGMEGCDPDSVGSMTALQVPPLVNLTWQNLSLLSCSELPDSLRRREVGYSARLHNANDISLIVDDVLSLVQCDLLPPKHDRHVLHQAYFISPDGLLRYWSGDRVPPSAKFKRVSTWAISPFIQEPLAFIAREGKNLNPSELTERLKAHLSDVLGVPYIDYGSFGLVQTRITPLIDRQGALVGVFCTDVSMQLFGLSGEEGGAGTKFQSDGTFFQWGLVELVESNGKCILRSPTGWVRAQAWLEQIRDLDSRVCEAAAQEGDQFFQRVQDIPLETLENTLFVVPLGRTPKGQSLLLLLPQAPGLPWKTLALALGAWIAFLAAILLRRAYETTAYPQEREATILRDLQAGVINVNSDGVIIEGNDRAEEILGTRLPNFGVQHDLADQQSLFELLDRTVLCSGPPESEAESREYKYTTMSLTEVQEARFLGLAFPFYARLNSPSESAKDRGPYGNVSDRWIRCKGVPVLGGERGGTRKRSVAVVHTVKKHRAQELDREWRRTRPGATKPGDSEE